MIKYIVRSFILLAIGYLLYKYLNRSKTYKDEDGYTRFKDSDKPVHRWVAEKMLGRKLRKGEVVHHKNRNKGDNDPDNLYVFKSQAEHDRAHKEDARKYGKKASYKGFRR